MTREELKREKFLRALDDVGDGYRIQGNKIIVEGYVVALPTITALPLGVEFNTKGNVYLRKLIKLAPDTVFNNQGDVLIGRVKELSPGVKFNNFGDIGLNSLTSIPPGVEFNNVGNIRLDKLLDGFLFSRWGSKSIMKDLGIKGIGDKRIFNLLIKKGFFI